MQEAFDIATAIKKARTEITLAIKEYQPDLHRLYQHFLARQFDIAKSFCISAVGGYGGTIDPLDMIRLVIYGDELHKEDLNNLEPEGWPLTPGITFMIWARNSALELIGTFVARVCLVQSRNCPHGIFTALVADAFHPPKPIPFESLNLWARPILAELKTELKLQSWEEVQRDCESLHLKFSSEIEVWGKSLSRQGILPSGHDESINAEWSKPMSKARMMIILGIDSYVKFNGLADRLGIDKINRSTYRIRLDAMDSRTRKKLEKA